MNLSVSKRKRKQLKKKGEIADWTEEEKGIAIQYKLTIITKRERIKFRVF